MEKSTCRIRSKKQLAGGTQSALIFQTGGTHAVSERPRPKKDLACGTQSALIGRRTSPEAPTPSLSLPPRLSPKSKSHAQPARGGSLHPSIYRQEVKARFFSFQFQNLPPPCLKKTYRHFFHLPTISADYKNGSSIALMCIISQH
jgi:hypothetical protein